MNKRNLYTLIIALLILPNLIGCGYKKQYKTNSSSVFRNIEDIDYQHPMFDDQAIALSDSFTNTSLRSEAFEAYNLVNEIRIENGEDGLIWNQELETVSNVRSKEISESFSHTRPNGKPWYSVNSNIQGGENLAYGYSNAEDAIEAWMNSPTHRDNILYEDFTKIAISIYEEDGVYYWSQEYGY